MNRRGFFGLLAGAAAGVAVSDELLELLTPTRSIFLPPAGGWIATGKGAGQVWNVSQLGGYFYAQKLSEILRQQCVPLIKFTQFVERPRYLREDRLVRVDWATQSRFRESSV